MFYNQEKDYRICSSEGGNIYDIENRFDTQSTAEFPGNFYGLQVNHSC